MDGLFLYRLVISFVPFLIYVYLFVGVDPIERWHTQLLV